MKHDDFSQMLFGAIMGDQDDLEKILILYDPLITKYSYVNGTLDEDLKQSLHIGIALNISKFQI